MAEKRIDIVEAILRWFHASDARDVVEFATLMQKLGAGFTRSEVEKMVSAANAGRGGNVHLRELVKWIMSDASKAAQESAARPQRLSGNKKYKTEEQAAVRIQAVFRGGKSRRQCSSKVLEKFSQSKEENKHLLGEYEAHYMVVNNKPECDEHYASDDPAWVGRASMSKHHRFLIRKDLHWQFFNACVFGLVHCSLQDAIKETERMYTAAKFYAANAAKRLGWSTNIGYYLHIFGHNSVNSLHLHIVDLDYVGPTFHKHSQKNCPVDEVLKCFHAEAKGEILLDAAARYNEPDDPVPEGQKLKQDLTTRYQKLNTAAEVQLVRKTLRNLGGADAVRKEFLAGRFLEADSEELTTGTNPFNVFARLAFLEEGGKVQAKINKKLHIKR